MSKLFRRTPSAPLVISILALVLAASGSAMAASKLVSGNSLIKKGSLSGNRLQNHTLTGTQINLGKLGTVPNATKAATAGSAAISTLTYVTVNSNAPVGVFAPSTAACPSGTFVIGGGGQVTNPEGGAVYVEDSYPSGTSGWTVDFANGYTSAVAVTTTAICAPAAATSGS
jgi:hypothetical protein